MLRFELLKILKNKLNLAAMLSGLLLIVIVFVSQNFSNESIYCEETDSYLKGTAAMECSKELAASQGEALTEEMLQGYLAKIQAYPGDLNSDDAYMDLIRKDAALFYYLVHSYEDTGIVYSDFNLLKRIDPANGSGFYERVLEKTRAYLDRNTLYGGYSDAEKDYWLEKAQRVETPFAWGSKASANFIYEMCCLSFYLLAVVIVCICPVFSKESEIGADLLLLTTKNGKNSMILSKVLSSYLFTAAYLLGCILFSVLLQGLTTGFSELSLPVQLWNSIIPYNLNMLEICLIQTLMVLVIALCLTTIICFLSALTKSTLASMTTALALLIIPAFIPYSNTSGNLNRMLDLCFIKFANLREDMARFVDYRLGSLILDHISMGILFYFFLILILLLPLRKLYVNRIIRVK